MTNIEYYGADAALRCKNSAEYQNGLKTWLGQGPFKFTTWDDTIEFCACAFTITSVSTILGVVINFPIANYFNQKSSNFLFKIGVTNIIVANSGAIIGAFLGVVGVKALYPNNKAKDYESVCPAFVHQTYEVGTSCPEGYKLLESFLLAGDNAVYCAGIITDAVATGA